MGKLDNINNILSIKFNNHVKWTNFMNDTNCENWCKNKQEMSDLIMIEVIEFITENLYTKQTSNPNGSSHELFETFRNK